jgi:hypothetical protein
MEVALDRFQLRSLMLAVLKFQTVSNKRTYEASYILYIHFKRHRFSCRTPGCFFAGFLPQISEFVTSLDDLEFVVEKLSLGPFGIFLPFVNLLIFGTLYHQ